MSLCLGLSLRLCLCLHALHHLLLSLLRHAGLVHGKALHTTGHHVLVRGKVLRRDAGRYLAIRISAELLLKSRH